MIPSYHIRVCSEYSRQPVEIVELLMPKKACRLKKSREKI